jgi:hypothetical protein
VRDRVELLEKNHPKISVRKQAKLLGVARSTITYKPVEEDPEDLHIKRMLDEIYMKDPCLGSLRLVTVLERDYDVKTDRKRITRLRREMGQETIWAGRALAFQTTATASIPTCCATTPPLRCYLSLVQHGTQCLGESRLLLPSRRSPRPEF